MDGYGHDKPRASGRRMAFGVLPAAVTDWIAGTFGEFQIVYEYKGGLSPGCATSILTTAGRPLFVKAVQADPSDVVADLFRHEADVLWALPAAPHRPALLGVFDDGDWVTLVLDHVDGAYPDLSHDAHMRLVAEKLVEQADELSPPPPGLSVPSLQETVGWWLARWEDIAAAPDAFLPGWATPLAVDGLDRCRRLAGALPNDTVCHFDIRNDNILVTVDGAVTILDWGIAMTGPRWVDLLMLAVQADDAAAADRWLREWISPESQDLVTDFLLAFGGSQAWDSRQPVPPRLPTLRTYLADDAERLLRAAQVRITG